jgi:glycerol-3-phosphate dehydrogenase
VVWSYAGVRPLVDDDAASARPPRATTGSSPTGGAPLLSVFGGKITTFRKLAEQAVDWIAPALGNARPGWTARLPAGRRPVIAGRVRELAARLHIEPSSTAFPPSCRAASSSAWRWRARWPRTRR